MDRAGDLGEFLRSRRGRLAPEADDTTAEGRRRVPGLRREEVARLAGVSLEYYTWLEQGRSKNASPAILDAIARALRLDEAERDHLFTLATPAFRPVRDRMGSAQPVPPGARDLLDALGPCGVPACVISQRMDVLSATRSFMALQTWADGKPARDRNLARFCFLDPRSRDLYLDWDHAAANITAMLRFAAGRHPGDVELDGLIRELQQSDDFRRVWAAHHVFEHSSGTRRYHHPIAGDFVLNHQILRLPTEPEQFLHLFTAPQGSPSAAALAMLATWAGPQESPVTSRRYARTGRFRWQKSTHPPKWRFIPFWV
ncbi:transcriptional regulator [Planotetraspora thailandica]|uniref:Transcriptional regulator n=1 Tax=Planotetraspora thailandica TaxID=487172 RepID=A0A8J3V8C6_9ACTN|nr:helix-turn-helix transcriptional regulator [Planotetraspora thailandica]GII55889.1 transcriptional regulator [Planotetraspora thailandica]